MSDICMHSAHVHAPFRHVMTINAWIVVNCMHLNYKPKMHSDLSSLGLCATAMACLEAHAVRCY